MKRTKKVLIMAVGMLLAFGLITGCKEEEKDEADGAIVEGTVLKGWDEPKGKIKVPDGVTIIGSYALSGKTEITGVTIPSSVLTIKEDAFSKCASLRSVTFEGNGLRTIENWAFNRCTSLTSMTIPDTVTRIDGGAFSNCDNLNSVTVSGEWESVSTSITSDRQDVELTASVLKNGSVLRRFLRKTE